MKKLKLALLGIPAFVTATASHAAVDVTALVAEITGVKEPSSQIGIAVLGVIVTIVTFLWIRRAIK